jgi:DNA polymerase-3 subunit gamma/tau
LIAKIAGIGTEGEGADGAAGELLQISTDEQRRAGRTAALFSEEELTRFLQLMLRTFDELGYRQEQRFHFELGLLKLVHLRRLLPVEELLSQFPAGAKSSGDAGSRGGGSAAVRRPASPGTGSPGTSPAGSAAPAQVAAAARPSFSPFEQSKKRFDEPVAEAAPKAAPAAPGAAPKPVAATAVEVKVQVVDSPRSIAPAAAMREPAAATGVAVLEPVAEPEVEAAAPVVAAENTAPAGESAEEFQRLAVEALQAASRQETAADAMHDALWTVVGGEIRVQTEVSKTMLPIAVNADAEKIIKAALRAHGAGALKLVLLPGSASSEKKKPRAAKAGSAEDLAAKHPVVQQAQRLFNAEIRNVIDLREAD